MKHSPKLHGMTPREAADHVMAHDVGDLLDDAEVVRERRPAKIVTAVRMDLDVQAELEVAAAARGIGVSTLMRQIIEEWVLANRESPLTDQISQLVRHLEAARRAADRIAHRAT